MVFAFCVTQQNKRGFFEKKYVEKGLLFHVLKNGTKTIWEKPPNKMREKLEPASCMLQVCKKESVFEAKKGDSKILSFSYFVQKERKSFHNFTDTRK